MLRTLAWYTFILVLVVSMLLFHTLLVRWAIAIDALPILVLFSSLSRERLLEIVEPRYVKSFIVSRVWWPMEMQGVLLTSWPMTFDFFRLMVNPNSSEPWAKLLLRRYSASSVWAFRAASSANSISLIRTLRTLVFADSAGLADCFFFFLFCLLQVLQSAFQLFP